MLSIPEALTLAQQALDAGDRGRAQAIYEQILAAAPQEPNTLNAMGVLLGDAGQLDAAESYLRRAVAAVPGNPAFHNNLYLLHRRQGRPREAIACCQRALELAPDVPELHSNLGVTLKEIGSLEEAVASFRRSLELKPTHAHVHYNLANALVKLHRLDEAERAFRRAIELAGNECELHNNLGTLLELQGRLDEAMACYDAALRCRSDSPEAHRNRSLLRLLLGDYAGGWAEYEWRWRMSDYRRPPCAQPQWNAGPLPGGTILLIAEQALGDTVQFVRYAPLVKEKSGARVVLLCPGPWHALLKTAPGVDRLVSAEDPQDPFDCYVPLLSLPLILGTTVATIPARTAYLLADHQRLAHWRAEFGPVRQFKVGIAWQGNPNFANDCYRSIPLTQFAPLADCDNVKLFSLQKNFGREQLAALPARTAIVDLGATLDEGTGSFVDTAAVMMNLDLVITSDTATAHVAAALGVPVWVALQYRPNWRWLLERNDSPWYPTMRLFRQSRFADWSDVFERMAAELQSLASRAGKPDV